MCYLVQNDALKERKTQTHNSPQKHIKLPPKNPSLPRHVKRKHRALSLAFSDTFPWYQDFRVVTKTDNKTDDINCRSLHLHENTQVIQEGGACSLKAKML